MLLNFCKSDDHGGAPNNDLPLVTLIVRLAEASLLAQLHVVGHPQSRGEFDVLRTRTEPQIEHVNQKLT